MSDTKDTSRRSRRRDADDTATTDTSTPDDNESFHEPMRRDHFPEEKGDNQQDDDYMAAEYSNPSGLQESNVKWPEVDSQEALDDKIDEEQTDKAERIRDAARDADQDARATADNG